MAFAMKLMGIQRCTVLLRLIPKDSNCNIMMPHKLPGIYRRIY